MKRDPVVLTVTYIETHRGFRMVRKKRREAPKEPIRYPIWHERIFTSPGLAPGKGIEA